MTIAIVIGTHGWAAEQLLKTAEMLLGEQENVGWIDFVPGENAETLIEKYNAQLAKLDTTKGVLFLVDTWGGSPFNAASRIVVDKEHYEVIAGVNIPMLVETLMARDDDPSRCWLDFCYRCLRSFHDRNAACRMRSRRDVRSFYSDLRCHPRNQHLLLR